MNGNWAKRKKEKKNTNSVFRSHAIFVARRLTTEIPLTFANFIYEVSGTKNKGKRVRSRGPLQESYVISILRLCPCCCHRRCIKYSMKFFRIGYIETININRMLDLSQISIWFWYWSIVFVMTLETLIFKRTFRSFARTIARYNVEENILKQDTAFHRGSARSLNKLWRRWKE